MRTTLVLTLAACLAWTAPATAQPPDVKATIAYVRKLQTEGGGFLSMEPRPEIRLAPTLRSTSSAVRALHYLGGEIPNKEACIKFVASCHDATRGGFSDFPRGEPDVFTTAVGIMAVLELKMPVDNYRDGAVKFMTANAKSFDDLRIAAAGFERLGKKALTKDALKSWSNKLQDSFKMLEKPKAVDEATSGAARLAASFLVTQLRFAEDGDRPEVVLGTDSVKAILGVIKNGQRMNGGFGKEGTKTSDLETTYRVMRAFVMLKAQPRDVEGVRSFVAKCRNADGGYGVSPGEMSNISATYFAAIIRYWAKDMK